MPEPLPAADRGEPGCRVTPRQNGPLVLDGPVAVVAADGTTSVADRLFLCRCGHSSTKPLCDGTHKRIDFRAPGVPPTSRQAG